MKLGDYLSENGIHMADFAAAVGSTGATICRVINGKVVPRRGLLEAIYRETKGLVTPNDLLNLHRPEEKDERGQNDEFS